jgi:hypothetical protein
MQHRGNFAQRRFSRVIEITKTSPAQKGGTDHVPYSSGKKNGPGSSGGRRSGAGGGAEVGSEEDRKIFMRALTSVLLPSDFATPGLQPGACATTDAFAATYDCAATGTCTAPGASTATALRCNRSNPAAAMLPAFAATEPAPLLLPGRLGAALLRRRLAHSARREWAAAGPSEWSARRARRSGEALRR